MWFLVAQFSRGCLAISLEYLKCNANVGYENAETCRKNLIFSNKINAYCKAK